MYKKFKVGILHSIFYKKNLSVCFVLHEKLISDELIITTIALFEQ